MGIGSRSALLTVTVALAIASFAAGCVAPADLNATTDALESDTITPAGWTFDPAAPIAQSVFTDTQAADEPSLQGFLAHSYYGTPSVLASYTANGSTAAAALVSASRQWGINPYVLLALAQAAARLVSALEYPYPSSRIEYTFSCGCAGDAPCAPASGGFDRQLDCLAAGLRQSIDAASAGRCTEHGWCVGIPKETDDGVLVTPSTPVAAAMYELLRDAGISRSGVWLVSELASKFISARRRVR